MDNERLFFLIAKIYCSNDISIKESESTKKITKVSWMQKYIWTPIYAMVYDSCTKTYGWIIGFIYWK